MPNNDNATPRPNPLEPLARQLEAAGVIAPETVVVIAAPESEKKSRRRTTSDQSKAESPASKKSAPSTEPREPAPRRMFADEFDANVSSSIREAHGAKEPIHPSAIVRGLSLVWLEGSQTYFIRDQSPQGSGRYIKIGSAELRRKLAVQGLYTNQLRGETASEVDRVLSFCTEVKEGRSVSAVVNVAGYPAGIHMLQQKQVLVPESPKLVKPVRGECGTIDDFLSALLGADALRFCCWLKVAFESLSAGQIRPGQALIIIGPPDCGKSRIQHQIITPMLGGRAADPKSFFLNRTDFNTELVAAEHLLIEEVPSTSKHFERVFFGERIKEVAANDLHRLHDKGVKGEMVSPFWRLSITLNDNPEKLKCLPPLTDDLVDKIVMLKADPVPEFWKRFEGAHDPRAAFRKAIQDELPAFAQRLIDMDIPPEIQGRRYGVKSYIPEELASTIFEGEREHHLLLLIDKGLRFWSMADKDKSPARWHTGEKDMPEDAIWMGDAEDLKEELCAEGSRVRGSAVKLLGGRGVELSTIGIWLRYIAEKHPGRAEYERTAQKRIWHIHPARG